jgi:aspartyl-tRNA(Asn)/glutamyl-tRNA(Gln) amidotransferase subunit C
MAGYGSFFRLFAPTQPDRRRMSLDKAQVAKIAHLARLRLDADEAERYSAELTRILGLIEQMNAVDTDGVEPMAHPSEAGLRLRPDEVTESDQREKFQAIAPAVEAGLYLVPKVID